MATFCPCVQYGRIVDELPQVSSLNQALSTNPDGVICGGSFWGGCLTYCGLSWFGNSVLGACLGMGMGMGSGLAFPCQVPLHLQLRTHMRRKYGIQGDCATDTVLDSLGVWCCAPCALCQETREITIRQAAERAELLRAGGLAPPPQQAVTSDPRVFAAPSFGAGAGPSAPPAYGTPVVMGVPVAAPAGKRD